MDITEKRPVDRSPSREAGPGNFFVDLVLYVGLMFLIREVYFPSIGFIFNGLFWSLTTLGFATWRMRTRGISWADLGLRRTKNIKTTAVATLFVIGLAIVSVIIFQIIIEQLQPGLAADTSNTSAVDKFGIVKDNWVSFFAIIPFVWLESFLEELLDRGFLMNWIERVLSSTVFATVVAVVLQAMIFGFRHSQDLSERSITVGLMGLAMGIGYVAFGRNLWPLIFAHCALNTMSMIDRVM